MNGFALKVFIVDDEENIRKLVKKHIEWTELGFDVVGEASSGREALDMLDKVIPDIVITDVRMPFMDGLELAGILRETYPYVKIVVLTAFEEFELAKKSIKLGVSDYLTKPVNRDELKNCLTDISNKIMEERISTSEYNRLKEKLYINFEYMKERFFMELLNKPVSRESIYERVQYYSVQRILDSVQVGLVSPQTSGISSGEELVLLDLACIDTIKTFFKDMKGIDVFHDMNNIIIFICSNAELNMEKLSEHLIMQIIHRLKCEVSISLSSRYDDCKYIRQAYLEAEEALKYSELLGKNQVICFRDISIKNCTIQISQDKIDEVLFYIKAGVVDKVEEIIFSIADNYIKKCTIGQKRIHTTNITSSILNAFAETGVDFSDICEANQDYFYQISKMDTFEQMKEFLETFAVNVTKAINNFRTKKSNKLLNEILYYINDNIGDPNLSLSGIANKFFLNSSYLCRLYKQETGQTFVEHLTKMRIDKAISLMNETELKVYQIGEQVGIPDPNYFGKCFKKFTGLCVNDYKKQYTNLTKTQ